MTAFDWLPALRARLEAEHVLVEREDPQALAPALVWRIEREDWGRFAQQASRHGCRWVAAWAEDLDEVFLLSTCVEKQGAYLIARTEVSAATPVLPSHVPYYAAADRAERHIQDLYGVAFLDHPDARRWTRHKAWGPSVFPLRKSFRGDSTPAAETPPDSDYPFLQGQGAGIYEIPVGPVHAGIIEPGHFRFQAVGETVLNLEERLGYVHKGIEKRAEGRDPLALARLAGRVSGDTTVGHAWAACMAMERAAGIDLHPRAVWLRALMTERERIGNHLWDIAAICNDVGFAFAYYQFGRLRELWLRDNQRLFGHRLMMDRIVPGGVCTDPDPAALAEASTRCDSLRKELEKLLPILEENPSLEDRLAEAGVLPPQVAAQLGALGFVGRASGQAFDVRRAAPYPPYDALRFEVPVLEGGDVAARLKVRALEIYAALGLLRQLPQQLPSGPSCAGWKTPPAGAEGLGLVEGWRGEILAYVRFGANNVIGRYYPRDPSWLNWPALEKLIRGNIVPDFPVCNKSVNGSYSGQDL
jgi:Ni,Fe-hydrogenase III large subunit/NADH:ubiquinone oxidoreductase subunit C